MMVMRKMLGLGLNREGGWTFRAWIINLTIDPVMSWKNQGLRGGGFQSVGSVSLEALRESPDIRTVIPR